MGKVPNYIKKFREYWQELDEESRLKMWYILTALRGPDENLSDEAKNKTTAKIRYFLFGKTEEYYKADFSSRYYEREIGFQVNMEPPKYGDLKHIGDTSPHFVTHIVNAYGIILHEKQKISMEDCIHICNLEVKQND